MATLSAITDTIACRVAQIAERVATPKGIEIVDVEMRGHGNQRLLRIYIDKPEGVSHGDCEFVSKNVGTILDVADVVPSGSYTLQVSSPGLERPLKRPRDFARFLGRLAKVVLREPIAGSRCWEGTLAGFSDGVITLEPAAGEPVSFRWEQVKRANLKLEW